jgi:hypothetical protein
MKKVVKVVGIVIGAVIVLLLGGLGYFLLRYPAVEPAPSIAIERTSERISRGSYLAHHVTLCLDCHSTRDWTQYSGPIIPGTEGKGGEEFNKETVGIPGSIFASNITPAGIGDYTDGELLRTITTGVTKQNRALFPLMPYLGYNSLTREDAYSIISYIRTLPPIQNHVQNSTLDFPVNVIVNTIPLQSYVPSEEPDRSNPVKYGKYLVTIAGCADCHTPQVKGERVAGMEFAGGFEFHLPGGTVRSKNITPDEETGIGTWSKDIFISMFKSYGSASSKKIAAESTGFNTPMPWTMFGGMADEDLGAIYEYLRVVPPVHHPIDVFTQNK